MPTEESEPQQQSPAWPEMPPAWPEAPSSFTPSARSFADPTPAYGQGPVYGAEPPATQYGHGRPDPLARPSGTDPFGRPFPEPSFQEPSFQEAPVQEPPFRDQSFREQSFQAPPFQAQTFPEQPFQAPPFQDQSFQSPPPFQAQPFPERSFPEQTFPEQRPFTEPAFPEPSFPGAPVAGAPLPGTDPFGRPMPADATLAVTPPHPAATSASPLSAPVQQAPLSAPPPLAPPHLPHSQPQSQPQQHQQHPPAPADDPYRPFVTAGQISGPKTPPAHRQQELWNTVFGENYQAMDEYEDEERGRPVWLFALAGSVAVALIVVLVWAFTAGPLSSNDSPSKNTTAASASGRPSTAKTPNAQQSATVPGLPTFEGTASPVAGRLVDQGGGISVARLGGQWQTDGRTAHVQQTYGFNTRQYVSAGMTTRGKPEFAQVMTGPLPQALAARYSGPDRLAPVLGAVVTQARQTLFSKGSVATKVAQQKISRGGVPGLLAAFKVKADKEQTTVVVAALTPKGAQLPTIIYMQVPELKADLLPDINTIFKSIRPTA